MVVVHFYIMSQNISNIYRRLRNTRKATKKEMRPMHHECCNAIITRIVNVNVNVLVQISKKSTSWGVNSYTWNGTTGIILLFSWFLSQWKNSNTSSFVKQWEFNKPIYLSSSKLGSFLLFQQIKSTIIYTYHDHQLNENR